MGRTIPISFEGVIKLSDVAPERLRIRWNQNHVSIDPEVLPPVITTRTQGNDVVAPVVAVVQEHNVSAVCY
jgi:hypothetical protein